MRILQLNKFFYLRGGSSRYFFEVSKLLAHKGHKVGFFSMLDEKNNKSNWSKYFASPFSHRTLDRLFYSYEVNHKLSKLLDEFPADIAHLHTIYHQLSPSLLLELKKRNIPVIQTVHDYHLISLNYNLFHNGKICEITKQNLFYKGVVHKCRNNSYLYTFMEVIGKYFQYYLGWERNLVDLFIAPSYFMKNKLIEYGVEAEKIINLPHFIDHTDYQPNSGGGDYVLYFGRLSEEKGLSFLIMVISQLPKIKLLIVGRGDEEENLKKKVEKLNLTNIKFLGFKDGIELRDLIRNCQFTILPSLWYEVFGMSILESFASGRTVLASKIGAIPEIIKDGINGFLFDPGNTDDCKEKILKLWSNPVLIKNMGKNGRESVEKKYG